jgi:hypothetical protein
VTNYQVLRQENAADHMWSIAGPPVEAVSAEAAIRKAVTDKGGTFVAVPLRSWAPVTVEVLTTRVLKLVGNDAG